MAKSVFALFIMKLAEDEEIRLDLPLASYGHEYAGVSVTLTDLMSHQANLADIDPVLLRLLPVADRHELALRELTSARSSRREARFAAAGGGVIVLALLDRILGGEDAMTWACDLVADGYGLPADSLFFTCPANELARFDVNWERRGRFPIPLLAEATPEVAQERSPDFGLYATTEALWLILQGIYQDVHGAGRVLAPSTVELMLREHSRDSSGRRFGLWWLVEMSTHGLHGAGPRTFGAFGEAGCCIAALDLDSGNGAAIHHASLVAPEVVARRKVLLAASILS
ncbi:MAG: serine hydrolase domain-containing protein [Microthrixaceae bacterium]